MVKHPQDVPWSKVVSPDDLRSIAHGDISGEFTTIGGEEFYRIRAYDRMPPFLMNLPSESDVWMFVSSRGGVTAGRVGPNGSLFPYETVDKLYDGHHHTGPMTLLRVWLQDDHSLLWRPFGEEGDNDSRVERNLSKNILGNQLVFEEVRTDLALAFRYRWATCDQFGLVRTATIERLGTDPVRVDVLDGLRNVLPYGAPLGLYEHASCLVDAYKQTDCDSETGVATFSLTSKIIDRPEAAEELRANVVWCVGLESFDVHLSAEAFPAFVQGRVSRPQRVRTGARGSYVVFSSLRLEDRKTVHWHLVADVGCSPLVVTALQAKLRDRSGLAREVEESLAISRDNLMRNVASADGLERTGHVESSAHRQANALFNNMRGGVFANGYAAERTDLLDFLRVRNQPVATRNAAWLAEQPEEIDLPQLWRAARDLGDADLERLCFEYLPLYFGRRHGDPSRPWNQFEIRVRDSHGNRVLAYEGNWRDIFQNWEALGTSFPRYFASLVAKFVNASTGDGFNPYRITRTGIDWEVPDPENPWGTIGYWGDHQIIYLLRLVEALRRYSPQELHELLLRECFSYADVPYRLRPFAEILQNPHTTILFDESVAARVRARCEAIGSDGKLVHLEGQGVYHVNLVEKLLVPGLSKIANLVPGGGIWMNTQRPEWNDANNALVGHGVSMVTLYHLRSYLKFISTLVTGIDREGPSPALPLGKTGHAAESAPKTREVTVPVSVEVVHWLRRTQQILRENLHDREAALTIDGRRQQLMEALGEAFSEYRARVYTQGFSGRKEELSISEVQDFCLEACSWLDHSVRANRREDGLFHSYNVLTIDLSNQEVRLGRLAEMLEGQVAVLGSGIVDAPNAVDLLESLFASRLYQENVQSFLLYPERRLPEFLSKNLVPHARVRGVPLLERLLSANDTTLVSKDAFGGVRFHADFRNAHDVTAALDRLSESNTWAPLVGRDREAVLEVFEEVFHHHTFTGRSQTMYGYEGIGCVYWHMVAKLLLAIQEVGARSVDNGEAGGVIDQLAAMYFRVRRGLGFEKEPSTWGAFPTDPYSHTPGHAGAQQPGMTGQVKEGILARQGELGIRIWEGGIRFRPWLLTERDFLRTPETFWTFPLEGSPTEHHLSPGSLAFTLCQTPVIFSLGGEAPSVRGARADGVEFRVEGNALGIPLSQKVFDRSGEIQKLEVAIPTSWLAKLPGEAATGSRRPG